MYRRSDSFVVLQTDQSAPRAIFAVSASTRGCFLRHCSHYGSPPAGAHLCFPCQAQWSVPSALVPSKWFTKLFNAADGLATGVVFAVQDQYSNGVALYILLSISLFCCLLPSVLVDVASANPARLQWMFGRLTCCHHNCCNFVDLSFSEQHRFLLFVLLVQIFVLRRLR